MKAIVMETRKNEAAVLLEDGTFRKLKGRYTVGETVEWSAPRVSAVRRWAAAAAAAAVIGTGGLWYDANYVAYGEVSLDVNPSIVYTVNRRGRVLRVRGVNSESEKAVDGLLKGGVRFLPVSEAIERSIVLLKEEGYLDAEEEDYVLLNVSADSKEMQNSLSGAVEDGMGRAMEKDPTMAFRIDRSDRETARRAEENHMSPGRWAAWEQAGDGTPFEEYADKPVREILGMGPDTEAVPDAGVAPVPGAADTAPKGMEAGPEEQFGRNSEFPDGQDAGAKPDMGPADAPKQEPAGNEAPAGQAESTDDPGPADMPAALRTENTVPQTPAVPAALATSAPCPEGLPESGEEQLGEPLEEGSATALPDGPDTETEDAGGVTAPGQQDRPEAGTGGNPADEAAASGYPGPAEQPVSPEADGAGEGARDLRQSPEGGTENVPRQGGPSGIPAGTGPSGGI